MFYCAPYPVIPVSIIVSISILSINVYHHKFIICHFFYLITENLRSVLAEEYMLPFFDIYVVRAC
jgi:hypothetical protein